jgi:hypothetical protein
MRLYYCEDGYSNSFYGDFVDKVVAEENRSLLAQVVAMAIGLCVRCCACMVFVVAMCGIRTLINF